MTSWTPISGPYAAPNGMVVEALGSDEALARLGSELKNGLTVDVARAHWASLCAEGRRQILQVTPPGAEAATAGVEVEVKRGEARVMFVRGLHNREFALGQAEHDAVTSYIAAVNARAIPLLMEPAGNGFAEAAARAEQVEAASPWERAIAFARRLAISPFKALVMGDDEVRAAEEARAPVVERDAEENLSWATLSNGFPAANGLTVEPVGDLKGLKKLGEELENNLFQMYASYAGVCQSGRAQFAAIYHGEEGIVGYAELRVVAGTVVPVACRSRFDYDPSPEMTAAVREYARAVNGGTVTPEIGLGANGFVMDGQAAEVDPLADGGGHFDASSTLGRSAREGFVAYGGGYDGDGYDGEEGYDEEGYDEEGYDEEGYDDERDEAGNVASGDHGGGYGPRAPIAEGIQWAGAQSGPHDYSPEKVTDVDGTEVARTFRVEPPIGDGLAWQALSGQHVAANGLVVEPVASEASAFWIGAAFDNALAAETHRATYVRQCVDGHAQILRVLDVSGEAPTLVGAAFVGARDDEVVLRHAVSVRNRQLSGAPMEALRDYVEAANERRIELAGQPGADGFSFDGPRNDLR